MQRNLVIQLARFGDLIQSKRLICTLSELGEVHLAVDSSLKDLAEIVYPQSIVHILPAHGRSGPDPGSMVKRLRKTGEELSSVDFSRVYNLNYSGMNMALAALFPWEKVRGYGYKNGQWMRDKWSRQAFRWTRNRRLSGVHLTDFWAGYHRQPVAPGVVNPPAKRGGKGVGVVMAGRHSRRSLTPEVLAPLVEKALFVNGRGPVTLLGAKGEQKAAKKFCSLLRPAVLDQTNNTVGKTDWKTLTEEIAGMDMVLTPDTGTMHLAAHLGVPVKAFFLSSAWCFETGPYGLGHRVYQAATECSPCLEARECGYQEVCFQAFSSRGFLRNFLTSDDQFENTVDVFRTAFDPLGVTCEKINGVDSLQPVRDQVRATAAALQRIQWTGPGPSRDIVEELTEERDWMLPGPLQKERVFQ